MKKYSPTSQSPLKYLGPAFAICALASTAAQGYGPLAAHLKVTKVDVTIDVRDDLSAVKTNTVEQQALSDTGAVAAGKFTIHFNPDLESVEILQGYTEKADGRRVPVLPENIQRQTGLLTQGSTPNWPGVEVRQITFPAVQAGDRTFVQWRIQQHQTPLPGWLAEVGHSVQLFDWDWVQWRITAPAHLDLQVQAWQANLEEHKTALQHTWQIQASSRSRAPELQTTNSMEDQPHWMFSSLKTLEQLGDAYAKATREKIQITPEVQGLADEITRSLTQPQDKARAIHQWIRQNIRYVAVYLGTGGFVPHDVQWILRNRYGDCKDHVLLMMSLLQASGIESAPVLINTRDRYELPTLPVPVFDHVLVYIPSLEQFVDPTFHTIPYGKLSWKDSAKPVVVGLAQGAKTMRTPTFKASDNTVRVKSVWSLDAQGNAKLDMQVHTTGEAATTMQDQLDQIPPGMSGEAVQRFLKPTGLKGSGFLQYPKVQRDLQEQSFSAQVDILKYVRTPEAGSLNPHPMVASLPIYVARNLGPHTQATRRTDLLCIPISIEEEFELQLPANTQILFSPEGSTHEGHGISYRSHYETTGTHVKGQRRFTREPTLSGHICSPGVYAARKPILNAIEKDLRNTVLFKSP